MRLLLLAFPFVAALVRAGHYNGIPHRVKESIDGPPHGWLRHGPAPSNHLLELKIALPQPHFPILEEHLFEVSNPQHERYGAYLSKEETDALMAPHPETIDVVSEWLSSHGIEEEHLYRSSAQDWVMIRVPVSLAEEMLDTKYDVYVHSDSGESVVRTTSYSLPESLHEHVELVQPTRESSVHHGHRCSWVPERMDLQANLTGLGTPDFKKLLDLVLKDGKHVDATVHD